MTEYRGEGQREVSRMTETFMEIGNCEREPSVCVVCCCYYRYGGGLVGGQQSIMNLVLDRLGLRVPGDLKMRMTHSLQLREVWAGERNLAVSKYTKSAVLGGIQEKGKSPDIL